MNHEDRILKLVLTMMVVVVTILFIVITHKEVTRKNIESCEAGRVCLTLSEYTNLKAASDKYYDRELEWCEFFKDGKIYCCYFNDGSGQCKAR